jgi:hypothetical protein
MITDGEFASGTNLNLPSPVMGGGYQLLCGVQALAYTRIRMVGNNDFQRTERQRDVIGQMAYRASDASLGTINEIVDIVFEYLATNFTLTEIVAHARHVGDYQIGETAGFPFDLAMKNLERTGSTLIPATLEANVAQLHEFLFGTQNFAPSSRVQGISADIAWVTATTVESAVDIDESWDFMEPGEFDPWDPEINGNDEPWPGNEYEYQGEPIDDVPWEEPPVNDDGGYPGGY